MEAKGDGGASPGVGSSGDDPEGSLRRGGCYSSGATESALGLRKRVYSVFEGFAGSVRGRGPGGSRREPNAWGECRAVRPVEESSEAAFASPFSVAVRFVFY